MHGPVKATVSQLRYTSVNLSGQFNPPTFADTRIPVFGYLIKTKNSLVLVDSGVGVGNSYIEKKFAPEPSSFVAALAAHDVEPSDVDVLINSHLHFDHCGNNVLCVNASIVVQSAELGAARQPNYTVSDWFDYPSANLTSVDGDLEVETGVNVLAAPGHTPGHQSVLVDTGAERILIAAQAAFTSAEYQSGGDANTQAHEALEDVYVDSLQRLKSLNADKAYFSHDPTPA
ncbi:MAG: MBL fold metallo-hydrolase [Pseudomonadales bacterium]|nr:MBL fold metallo-hydrolase [Pseudomonadales bacterium]